MSSRQKARNTELMKSQTTKPNYCYQCEFCKKDECEKLQQRVCPQQRACPYGQERKNHLGALSTDQVVNVNGINIVIPFGIWDISFSTTIQVLSSNIFMKAEISTSSTSFTNNIYNVQFYRSGQNSRYTLHGNIDNINYNVKSTTIYLLYQNGGASTSYIMSNEVPTSIKANLKYI